ncbi:MAG TPA: flagellar biosynthetic protein FliQ [Armatimonadota bacterium]|nr:flagellar biosynthetic protein FliQ [Armatimonadota bacterium]
MTETTVLELAKQSMLVGIQVSAPLLLASLVTGTLVGVIMAATQIQEFTLTFVPKLIIMGLVLLIAGPWMLRSLMLFATLILGKLAGAAY